MNAQTEQGLKARLPLMKDNDIRWERQRLIGMVTHDTGNLSLRRQALMCSAELAERRNADKPLPPRR